MFPKKNEDEFLWPSVFSPPRQHFVAVIEVVETKDMKGKPKFEWIEKKLRKGNCSCLREETTTEASSRPSLSAMAKPFPCVEAVTVPPFLQISLTHHFHFRFKL